MTEEVVVATGAASPEPLDHKRKLADLDNEATEAPDENHGDGNEESGAAADDAEVAVSDESEAKRPRLEEELEENASENGHYVEKPEEPAKEDDKQSSEEDTEQPASEELAKEDDKLLSEEDTEQPPAVEEVPGKEETEQPTAEPLEAGDAQDSAAEISQEDKTQELSKEENQHPEQEAVSNAEQNQPSTVAQTTAYRIEVPNSKVGVLIGKAGDTIRYLQYNSGAKIQIMRDSDADPNRLTRPVEIVGTPENIKKAEKLINAVIAEADAGGSPSLIAKGLSSSHSTATAEQIQMQVPNEKVGLIIGRGGETIKNLQTRSGARIQLIPQNLPEGDESKERTVRITGDKKQIEIATDMIKEVMNQNVRPSPHSTGFNQQAHRPRGPSGGPTQWGQRGPHPSHPASYDYPHRGSYPSHNAQYQHPSYGNYPQQMSGPRSSYNSGWEQRPPPSMQQGPPPSSGGYDYYGGRNHYSDAPPSHYPGAHAPGPSPAPAHGPPQTQSNYYSQQQSQGYGHGAPYSQAAPPHQSYGHGYEQKYDHHAPAQNPYGGHGSAQQPYPQAGSQQGYPGQQHYDKPPSYGAPAQAPPPQSYGAPRVGQPGEPYQGGTAPASYGQNMQTQQAYQYPTGGTTQQYPPYGTAPTTDGYNQAPASASYPQQQGGQTGYGQPGVQQPSAYGQQAAPAAAYGQYPTSQQGYPDQAAANAAGYAAYQAPQDPAAYNAAQATAAAAYTAPASGQPGYAQTVAQPTYDQSIPQPGYGTVPPSSAPVGSGAPQPQPQPGYAQYDSTQVYGASR